nr:hypothetical protein [Tanacetum cinerariifolium]
SLLLPPPYHQFTSSSSGIRSNMTRKLGATGKKKATLIVIPIIRFTKLVIHHLQRRHRFHPRPDSPLHLPNEEPVLGYLKFSAKDIQEASYYQEYLAKVAQHQRYLAGETGSNQDFPTPKPVKPARKPKPTAPKAPPRQSVSTPVTSAQPAPTSAPAKPQEKKRKQSVAAEDADLQKALEESMKSVYDVPRGQIPPVVIREPESGKYQPLPEVPGKGKAKVTKEQVAYDLLSLQKLKKKSPTDQYIFQRRTSTPTGSSGHDEPSYVELGQSESEESKKVMPGTDEGGQGKGQAGPDPGSQAEGQTGLDVGAQEEGQAGSNPDENSKGQAVPDPGNAEADVQSIPSPVVHAGSDREHMDLDVADVSPQPSTEQLDEGFTATAYPKVSKAVSKVVTKAVDWAMQAPLQKRFRDLPEADMKEILHQRMWESESYKSHEDHMQLYEALEKSINRDHSQELAQDLAKVQKKKKNSRESPNTPPGPPSHQPPPPPPPAGPSEAPRAFGSSQVPPPPPLSSSINQENLEMDEDMGPDEHAHSSDDEDIGSAHIPMVNLRQDWWKPFEEERPTTPEPAWSIPSSDVPVLTNNWASALASNYSPPLEDSLLAQTGPAFEIIKVFHPAVIHLHYQMEECHKLQTNCVDDPIIRHNVSKPLPLGGPPGQVTIQSDFFFNKDLEYIRYDSKGSRPALSISKMKTAYYPDVGLEQMVPDQFWIKEECKYDIVAIAVRTHMRILSVVRIKVFSMYGYDYIKKIVLRRADLNEHVIAKRDFKYMYPSDFKDLYLLNLQEDFQLGIESYQTQLNLTKPQWNATGFEYKHDYTIIDSPRAVMFWDKYRVQMMMRFNDIHKFNDGTLQQIDEALDYRVKEFKINKMNPGLNTSEDGNLARDNIKQALGSQWVFNSLVHSFRALSALRRSSLRTASTAAKPCQGDSSKFYLITGSIYTDQQGTVVLATLFNESEQRHFCSFITNVNLQESRRLQLLAKEMSIHNSMLTL